MRRYSLLILFLALAFLLAACGGSHGSETPVETPKEGASAEKLEILEATFAHGLDENMGPVDPDNTFQPEETIYLAIKLKDKPREGVVSARFMYGDQEIAETAVDIGEALKKQGVILVIGGNTQVGFTLSHEKPFPPGDEYKAKVYLNGKPAGEYPFVIASKGAESPTPSEEEKNEQAQTQPEPTQAPATSQPTQAAEHTVVIHALWYATDPSGKAIGGVSPVRVSVRPSQGKQLRVGFFEEEVGGSGPMWRSAGWTAVVMASQLLGVDPRDYEFSFSVGGKIDGPSAGGYMTVAVLAALQGDDVAEDIFMTGTINPDGTIGPVGGIPQKIEGAAANGARMVLVPAGLRYDMDANTKKLVDVVEVGDRLGVKVREVSTVYEAYEFITGQSLPRPAVSTAVPQLPPRAFDRTRAKAQEWLARYQDARGRVNSLVPEIVNYLEGELKTTDATAQKADRALQQGMAAVAYARAVDAAAQAQVWLLAGEMLQRYLATGDINSMVEYLGATQSALTEKDAVLELLRTEQPRSPSDYVALFDAYTSLGKAEGLVVLAQSAIQDLVNNADEMNEKEFMAKLMEVSAYYVLARDFVQLARDSVDIGFGYGQEMEIPEERVEAMSELLRHASDANLDYFESVIINHLAETWGVHPKVAKNMFMNFDWTYLFAVASDVGVKTLSASLEDPEDEVQLELGNSISNYALTSALVAKHYALGARLDEDGNITSITRERALADMLDLADRRARELIALNGDDASVMAILYYENARMKRQGDPEDQLTALKDYWTAAALATVQAYLSGTLGR